MKTLGASIVLLVLALVAGAQTPESLKEVAGTRELTTRYFRFDPAFLVPTAPGAPDLFPIIHDGLEKEPRLQTSDAQPFFIACGVEFPSGASAVCYHDAAIIGVKNLPENLAKIEALLQSVDASDSERKIGVTVHVVEFPMDVEDQLAGGESLTDLERKLGLKLVLAETMVATEGDQCIYDSDHPGREDRADEARMRGQWPSPAAVPHTRMEVDAVRDVAVSRLHIGMTIWLHLAVPTGKGQPPIEDQMMTNLKMIDGHFLKVRTFSLPGPDEALHNYAILVRCDLLDPHGRNSVERRAALRGLAVKRDAAK